MHTHTHAHTRTHTHTHMHTHVRTHAQVQGTWGNAGVLVASVHHWEEFSRSVPERELGAVLQTLVTAFGQMVESVGLVVVSE
jgi:hypothetical protein